MSELTKLDAWNNLQTHYQNIEPIHMRDMFAEDSTAIYKLFTQA